jgi:hypothetical protein
MRSLLVLRHLIWVLAIISVSDCASSTGDDGRPLQIQFSAERVYQRLYPDPVLTLQGTGVIVDGEFELGAPCFDLDGAAKLNGGVITLDIVVKSNGSENCQAVISLFRYRATISNLPSGPYSITVWHVNGVLRYSVANWSFELPSASSGDGSGGR